MSTSSSKAPSKASPAPDKGDDQVQTDAAGAVYEALVQQPNGHRTVVRSKASSPAAAER
jgi:hypothetical protein